MGRSQCPAESCRAADPNQRPLVEAEIATIQAVDDKGWPSSAKICTYCRCVYSYGPDGRKIQRGFLEESGWKAS